jgi:eukaryotic-like serine/threonine-protein kinase
MSSEIPGQIGPYRVQEQTGREGGAALFRGLDPSGRTVTVQLLPSRLMENARVYEIFRTEAAALAREGHPNLLRVLGTGQEGDRPYLALEDFQGKPLSEILRSRRLTVAEAFAVMKAICRGLAHAHEKGVIHRHLSPQAVRVLPDLSQVKLAEFGFSRMDALGMTGTISTGALSLGAFHYLAPEQMDGKPVDHRADLYSAGVVFQEMLTGRPPGERTALPSQINSALPPQTDVVVLKCLARNLPERYATAIDVLNAIEKLEESMQVRLLSELRDITQPGSRSKALLWGAVVLVLVVLVVVGILMLG